ncbi:PLP-dependent aminotransferase family protein [Cohnella panacarvi]|uniref:MocR-like pyridoxine biosynthesis transcription factor PdxR n=1 Tax=Cohnella panacarvi TaxID=400776 RepID=UPI00047AF9F1|nr:PLP-dependent aminotransferase family protein [Cohnella panacarvi]
MITLTPTLDKTSGQPLYLQLYAYIRDEIEAGAIPAGDKLPAILALSAHLKVSKNTVETAYQQLVAEGYAESRSRSGLYALPVEEPPHAPPSGKRKHPQGRRGTAAPPFSPSPDASGIAFDFRYGDVEMERFPMGAWRRCLLEALNDSNQRRVLDYGHPQGEEELRSEIAGYLYQSRGIPCTASQIVLCAGTQHSVSMMCQLIPLRGMRVALEDPGYNGVRTSLYGHGCELVHVPLDADGIQVDRLYDTDASAVYITPSHQFPLGMVLPIQRRNKLLQWANERNGLIIEDDYDSEFRYVGQPIPALKAMDHNDRVIYMGTLSKSFLPAARLSYIVLPEPIARSVREKLVLYSQPVSPLIQQAMLRFMREGFFGRHVRKMRRLYQLKHRALLAALQRHMGARIEIIGQKAGLHLLIDVKAGIPSAGLIDLASKVGIRVYSPAVQWSTPSQCPPSYIMLGFGGLNEYTIDEAVGRLAGAWFKDYDEVN